MALRATVFKIDLHVADNDRPYYGSHALTIARHPSETDERMMARVLAFAMHAHEDLAFTRGLSDTDEPDIWRRDLTGAILQWIEVGHLDERRVVRASRQAGEVALLCYGGHASEVWWRGVRGAALRAGNVTAWAVPPEAVRELAAGVARTMTLHVSAQDGALLVTGDAGTVGVEPVRLD